MRNGSDFPSWRLKRWALFLATLLLALAVAVTSCTAPTDPPPGGESPPKEEPPPGEEPPPSATGAWTTAAASGDPRQEVSYVRAGGKFYLTGGSRAHEVYDPQDDSWSEAAPLPAWRDHIQGVAVGTSIYYIGGIVTWPSGHQSSVFVYDTASDTFTNGTGMERGRGAGGVAVHDGLVYYAGGLHDGAAVDWFDVYDPDTDLWASLDPMPHVRDHFHAAVVGDRFYAIGGRDGAVDATIAAVDVYDFGTGTWSTLDTALPTPRGGFATAVLGDEILVIGGEGGGDTYDLVEAYDTGSNTWRTLEPMATARHGIQAATCNDTVYVAAGGTVQGGGGATNVHEVFALDEPQPCPDPLDTFTEIEWTELDPDPHPRAEAQGIAVGDRLYVFGGFEHAWNPYCTTLTSHAYDTVSAGWHALNEDLPGFWTHSGHVSDGDDIIFAGMRLQGNRVSEGDCVGQAQEDLKLETGTREVWTFDTTTETWSNDLPDLPAARSSGGFARVGRTLHFFSGTNEDTSEETSDHWTLDLDDPAAAWQPLPLAFPNPRNHMGVATLGGRIYAVGGQWDTATYNQPQTSVHRFDPAEGEWTELAPLPVPTSHIASTIAIGGRIVVFGGEQVRHGNPVNDVLAYDPAEDSWTALTPIPDDPNETRDWGSRAGVVGFIDGAIYYVRGEFSQQAYRGTPVLDP